eukprot:GFUD01097435.1.p1 GENE.GFUD01097435.1~~GFUD01097435.1.p1  ORF type:complete len:212 (+),score=51.79 GFUD01097435.1:43-678(+)
MKMTSRVTSVPTVRGVSSNGPNHDALRDIRKQMDTNNRKNEAVSLFIKKVLLFTIIAFILQLLGWVICVSLIFLEHDSSLGTITAWIPTNTRPDPPAGWVVCNGTTIREGDWQGQKTPNLTGAFLMGANYLAVSEFSDVKIKQGNITASIEAELGHENDAYPGFCLQQNQLKDGSSGCANGQRYENNVTIRKKDDDPLVNNVEVLWIMKCW